MRKARARLSDRPTGFLWVEKDAVAASGLPASKRQLEWISRQGVGAVLTLTEEPLPEEWTSVVPLSYYHVPMKDHEPPSVESIGKAVALLEDEVRGGHRTLVHCLAGQGRTMCVLAAYLIKDKGAKPEDAIRMLRAMRPGAVEREQEKSVYGYAAALGR